MPVQTAMTLAGEDGDGANSIELSVNNCRVANDQTAQSRWIEAGRSNGFAGLGD
jgi:hypothetical protein